MSNITFQKIINSISSSTFNKSSLLVVFKMLKTIVYDKSQVYTKKEVDDIITKLKEELEKTYVTKDYADKTYATKEELEDKQDTLVSGTNIKTINNNSILGSGNLTI